ncbi:MAG: hypothetical protein G01um101470_94 [Parcubacteria group bacterium Gr01-1014_70]|nr:MAG: hypothetical protein G01um101470_94 [Parcubacteria group bacterium Gr01-1014_70]
MIEAIKKNLIFVGGLVAILGLGVFWLFIRDTGEIVEGEAGIIEQPSQYAQVRAEILGTIATLQAVRLDVSVLDDPAFQSLTEAPRPEDVPFAVGKRNPFLP